jgi:hypothetical protein
LHGCREDLDECAPVLRLEAKPIVHTAQEQVYCLFLLVNVHVGKGFRSPHAGPVRLSSQPFLERVI